jgi:glucose-6-phosphate 1-dehydrogenase
MSRAAIAGTAESAPPAPGAIMIIFGAGGDLTKRLLLPALYNLARAKLLSPDFKVLGVDHVAGDDDTFRSTHERFFKTLAAGGNSEAGEDKIDAAVWSWLSARLFYQTADFEDDTAFRQLAARIDDWGADPSILFYLAVPPRFVGDIVERLARTGLTDEQDGRFRRVVIEKPFGHDLASAKALDRRILACLSEGQIYRIDHFLGKETVRNILVTRFANGVFEPLWNRSHIDHVQITAAETLGVEGRGAYYDKAGALRDMVPNHLFQLLALTAMEAPNSFAADAIRAEKARVLEAVGVQTPDEALANSVRGQYRAGTAAGRALVDYRHEPDVAHTSRTETYVALKLTIDNWRWAGVPFYLRSGKGLRDRDTEIAIQFKQPPILPFQDATSRPPAPNSLVLQIQPNEGISLQFEAKRPGLDVGVEPVRMDFRYADFFATTPSTGYETLIYDALCGDQTLFKRADDIEFAWRAVEPFLQAWQDQGEVHGYAAGSTGPTQADKLLARDGRSWRPLGQRP